MARRKKGQRIDGWINLNKPVDVTSTQAVGIIRRALNAQKVGHGGTLDPLADGILPIALGEATKTIPYIQDAIKEYEFTVTWGQQHTTDDSEGDVIAESDHRPTMTDIVSALPDFIGDIEQLPPQFSAIKINGERAYDIARDGDVADIKPRPVYIENLVVNRDSALCDDNTNNDTEHKTTFRCTCGKGTYIRAIARDLGKKLGCYGYISALRRTKVGVFTLETAFSLDFFRKIIDNHDQEKCGLDALLPIQTVLDDIPVLALNSQEAQKIRNGNPVTLISRPDLTRLDQTGVNWKSKEPEEIILSFEGKTLAIADITGTKIQPVRVFN